MGSPGVTKPRVTKPRVTKPRVINMWSGPRNISTAFMYSWRQRSDTLVFDEPFYGTYLSEFDIGHPGQDEIVASMELDVDTIVAMITAPGPKPIRYIKNIGHHLDALDPPILDLFENVLLVRDPGAMVRSLTHKIGEKATVEITGLPQQVQILEHELHAGRTPLVIDSRDLLTDPPGFLRRLCDHLQLPFEAAMLSWPAGPKPEDGVWAKYWYDNAHRSTGFVPFAERDEPLDPTQLRLLRECQPYFERLKQYQLPL